MVISLTFPQPVIAESYVQPGSQPYTFKISWDPLNKHSPLEWKYIHLRGRKKGKDILIKIFHKHLYYMHLMHAFYINNNISS